MNTAELQFHWMRLGNRPSVAKLFGFSNDRMSALLLETDQQRYMRGQMVNIGGILVKRCAFCLTAREVEHFGSDEARASGCKAECSFCREKRGVIPRSWHRKLKQHGPI